MTMLIRYSINLGEIEKLAKYDDRPGARGGIEELESVVGVVVTIAIVMVGVVVAIAIVVARVVVEVVFGIIVKLAGWLAR
jgi:hypothetical protein